jgi:hypothetical protein
LCPEFREIRLIRTYCTARQCFLTKKQKKLVRQNGALLISADEKVLFRSGTNYEKIYYGSLVAFAVY